MIRPATLGEALAYAKAQISSFAKEGSPNLEAAWLLSKATNLSKTHLKTYPEQPLDHQAWCNLSAFLDRRQKGEPLAYILQEWEFYGLTLSVNQHTLIPRADTEWIIDLALNLAPAEAKIADLGTGPGSIALAIKSQRPQWQVTATDISAAALAVAQDNGQKNQLDIHWRQGHWCKALEDEVFHMILANPPYIAPGDEHLDALRYEPQSALVAQEHGLSDLKHIIMCAKNHLYPQGWLLLEHGYNQAEAVQTALSQAGYQQIFTHQVMGQPRHTQAQWNPTS